MSDPALLIATQIIAAREGFRSAPYRDNGRGVWTIGYGQTYLANGTPVTADTPHISEAVAQGWLQSGAAKTLATVRGMVDVPISNNAAAALCSFAWNEGTSALRTSTLMDRLNGKQPMADVAACFAAWVYAGGHVDQGLINRRKIEAAMFLTPDAESAADLLDDEFNPPS